VGQGEDHPTTGLLGLDDVVEALLGETGVDFVRVHGREPQALEPVVGVRGEDVVDGPSKVGARQPCATHPSDVSFDEASAIRAEAADDTAEPPRCSFPDPPGNNLSRL
jgi:hypothetical protein